MISCTEFIPLYSEFSKTSNLLAERKLSSNIGNTFPTSLSVMRQTPTACVPLWTETLTFSVPGSIGLIHSQKKLATFSDFIIPKRTTIIYI